jgi:DNA repair exonuclease SbcCD ATPase subunit
MKLTAIKIQNILGVRAADIAIDHPAALIAGHNYAGKSSVQEAVRMALTGETVRVALKKEYGSLVTEGQDVGFAAAPARTAQLPASPPKTMLSQVRRLSQTVYTMA